VKEMRRNKLIKERKIDEFSGNGQRFSCNSGAPIFVPFMDLSSQLS
jgi:hypothetical protein